MKRARVALYHRVSTVDQNPRLARRELRAAARRQGLRVALDVEEKGSGANNDRPGLQRVLNAARRRKVDVVMVWKLDRFGRSAFDLLANLRQLDAAGVRFVALTQGLDLKPGGDAISRLLLTMLAAVAEFERDLIRERTRLGVAAARRAGKQLGRPRGPRPSRAAVERLRRGCHSWKSIARQLNTTVWAARQALAEKGGAVSRSPSRRRRVNLAALR